MYAIQTAKENNHLKGLVLSNAGNTLYAGDCGCYDCFIESELESIHIGGKCVFEEIIHFFIQHILICDILVESTAGLCASDNQGFISALSDTNRIYSDVFAPGSNLNQLHNLVGVRYLTISQEEYTSRVVFPKRGF